MLLLEIILVGMYLGVFKEGDKLRNESNLSLRKWNMLKFFGLLDLFLDNF